MSVKVGKTYYFIVHAYHHVIAKVEAITGKREADVTDVRWIYSCPRNWTLFFQDGAKDDTVCRKFPDGGITWLAVFEWNHLIPEAK